MDQPQPQRVGDTVLAIVGRDRLPIVLAEIHRAGFGSVARVFDPGRAEIVGQLRRLGLPAPPEVAVADPAFLVLTVSAPGRAALAAEAIARGGARRVYVTRRGEDAMATPLQAIDLAPDAAL